MATYLRENGDPHEVYLVQGEDLGLVSLVLSDLLEQLSRLGDLGLVPIEEYGVTSREEQFSLGPVLDACRTPPFLAERRVVVVRDGSALDAEQAREIVVYLDSPVETSVLVLVFGGRRAPAAIGKAAREHGLVIEAAPATASRARSAWFDDHLDVAAVRLDKAAIALVQRHLGDDLARLEGLLATLEAAFGSGARVSAAELEPYLGTEGGVAPWDLTDAIASTKPDNTSMAVQALHRLLGGGKRHPLEILAILRSHYGAILRLDGSGATDEALAATATGLKGFPARKALEQSRRLGHGGVVEATRLLAEADLDLRGQIGLEPELVLEILVARLARLSRHGAATSARS